MEKLDLAFFVIIIVGSVLTAITIVIVTNRDSWMPIARRVMSLPAGRALLEKSNDDPAIPPRSNHEPEPEPMPNAAIGSRTDDRTGAFVLNPDQQLAVTRMIYHKVGTPNATKATTIKAGFGVSKGESSRYKEASAIYDALFVLREIEKFPRMTEEQRSLRKELRLPVR